MEKGKKSERRNKRRGKVNVDSSLMTIRYLDCLENCVNPLPVLMFEQL